MKAMTAERCSGIKSGYWSTEKKKKTSCSSWGCMSIRF